MENKVFIYNLGCAKNLVDSEAMAGGLVEAGFNIQKEPGCCDFIIVNTCGFIQEAVEESLQVIMDFGDNKKNDQKLIVVGCLVGRYGLKLNSLLHEVDLFVSPEEQRKLPIIIKNHFKIHEVGVADGLCYSKRLLSTGAGWAYLKVSEGCNNYCNFCTIPKIKGRLRSRTFEDIALEIEYLNKMNIKEINLIAQDLTAYGEDTKFLNIIKLLEIINTESNCEWIRMHYLNPDKISKKMIDDICKIKNVLPYFDLPIQHTSKNVLRKMGRVKYGKEIFNIIEHIKNNCENYSLRGTVMLGHPGEKEKQFNELIEFVQKVEFDHLGCFVYRPEEGTKSSKMDRCSEKEAIDRKNTIMEIQKNISNIKLAKLVNKEVEVLVEGVHEESNLIKKGRIWKQAPEVDGETIITDGEALPGKIIRGMVVNSFDYDLEVHLLD